MRKKGSVTVFICLFLAVFIGLMQVLFRSVQIAGGRVQMVAGIEEGLYSVFAEFDNELFEKYHLFFLDATYGTESLNLGNAYHIVKEKVERSCSPRRIQLDIRGENLWNCCLQGGEITSYTLATDQNGASFKLQAINYMKDTLGIQGVQLLLESAKENTGWSVSEDASIFLEEGKSAQENYENEKERVSSDDKNQADVPLDFVNPLDVIKELKNKGILSLVVPLSTKISKKSVVKNEMLSRREIEVGIGVVNDTSNTLLENLLFQEYLMNHFECYTDRQKDLGMNYELEYIIAGKKSDIDNLKSVVTQLLAIREAANMVYLMKNPSRQAEIHQMSLLIATAIGLPAIESVISVALAAAWSFGESILDLRQLLDGGKVAVVKSDKTWKLSIKNLGKLTELLDADYVSDKNGISYEQYLRILIGMQNSDEKVVRAMEMIEHTMREIPGKEKFRLDCCVDYLEVSMCVDCSGNAYEIQRGYGYQM